MQFSEMLKFSTDEKVREEQVAWLRTVLTSDCGEDGDVKELVKLGVPEEELTEEIRDWWPGFENVIEEGGLWVYSDEAGNVDALCVIVRAFLKKFDVKTPFTLTWAETCSKPRLGEFGGGFIVVTQEKTYSGSTYSMVQQVLDELKENK